MAVRRRITPIAVEQVAPDAAFLGPEVPLDIGPAPDQGDVRVVHPQLGAGRRVWVDTQDSCVIKFKQVLRQQGLDYNTWVQEQDQKYSTYHAALHGAETAKRRPALLTGVLQRVQGMYQHESDEGGSGSDEDDSGDEADGDDDEGGDDGSSDDGEEGGAGDEIDLDKEAEAEAARKKTKRQRFERYEDDFIDDSEIVKVKHGPKMKLKNTGFFIAQGPLELVDQPSKPRARAAKAADAAADGSGPAPKRRKQPEQQHQPQTQQEQQQQQDAAKGKRKAKQVEAAQQKQQTGDGSEPSDAGGKKKRSRSEASGAAAADAGMGAPAGKKARKASPATSDAAAGAGAGAAAPSATAGAGAAGIAAKALAAAKAAAAKRPPTAGRARSSSPSGALPPPGPSAARKGAAAAAPAAAGAGIAADADTQQQKSQGKSPQPQQQGGPRRLVPVAVEPTSTAAATPSKAGPATAVAMAAAFPGSAPAAGVAAEAVSPPAQQLVDAQPVPGSLPEQVAAAVTALQEAVQQNEASVSGPAATSATRTKVLGGPLQALGMAFARLPDAQQHEHTAQLLAAAGPLLPHLSDKALRKKLVQDPRDKLHTQHEQRDKLLDALSRIKGGAAGGPGAADGSASDDDFQQAWSQEAEDVLVAAWNSTKAVSGQQGLHELAVDVCRALGNTAVQDHPEKAVAEVQQVFNRAKRRQKAAREESKAAAAAAAAAATAAEDQQQQQADAGDAAGAATAAAAAAAAVPAPAAQQEAAAPAVQAPPRAASPGVDAAAGDVAAGSNRPQQDQQPGRTSQDSDTATEGAGGDAGGHEQADAAAAAAAGQADPGSQHTKAEFSQWGAPSPRLQGCIDAAMQAGATEPWLKEKYQSIRKGSTHGHQAFRILCHAGPAGCAAKDFKAASDAAGLALTLDDTSRGMRQALSGKGMSNIVGFTDADHSKHALLAFPGVVPRPPKTARAATPAAVAGAQAEGQAGTAGAAPVGAQAAEQLPQ